MVESCRVGLDAFLQSPRRPVEQYAYTLEGLAVVQHQAIEPVATGGVTGEAEVRRDPDSPTALSGSKFQAFS